MKTALIMVDLQNDFCPGGSLAVPNGDEIIPIANALQSHFDIVVATQDWHPADHKSFAVNHPNGKIGDLILLNGISQVLWPSHCVQGTAGAAFHPNVKLEKVNQIIQKGIDREIDSYSAFFDNAHLRATGLTEYLRAENVTEIYLLGLATDYCVKYSALDAVALGFTVYVIQDACRGIELNVGDISSAYAEMEKAGVRLIHANRFI